VERPVDVVRELEARDEALAAAIADLLALEHETERLRVRATEIEALRERLPEERRALAQRLADGRDELDRRRADARRAQEELARAEEKGNRDQIAAARRALVWATDEASSAAKRVARIEQLRDDLEREATEAEQQAPTLEERAAQTAVELARVERLNATAVPGPGLAAVIDWAARERAPLLVARSSMERERESVVREANELGAAILGEPLIATSVASVRRRLEEPP